MNRLGIAFLTSLFSGMCGSCIQAADWRDVTKSMDPQKQAVAGEWTGAGGSLTTTAVNGSRITLPVPVPAEYDFRVSFTRTSGVHSIALFFVTSRGQASFEIDAWGQHLAGIQNVNGQDIRANASKRENVTLRNNQRYTALVQVRRKRVRAFLDDQLLADLPLNNDTELSIPSVWNISDATTLGLGAWNAATTFHSVKLQATAEPLLSSGNPVAGGPNPLQPFVANKAAMKNQPATGAAAPRSSSVAAKAGGKKRVLLVIANEHFFYREYADPLAALQQAGIDVDVAAGRKATCRPHPNSGQRGSGNVMPDVALSDVRADDYDAIMFSGGWGSSMYQYAFQGSYQNHAYNGDRRTKSTVNRLLNDFIRQDKYVGALCHGVSVLAWARVNGRSILAGKRAVASPRQGPAGNYGSRTNQRQPLSRWNAETNGARLTPARSIGNRSTSADDVAVDGKIITGEDDNSARLFGETLAKLVLGN